MKLTRLIISFAVALTTGIASAQTDTTFDYQGQLFQNGSPVDGSFNFTFELWDAQNLGNQVGPTMVLNGVPVLDGHFNVDLDFGADAFDNTNRWLEIAVNGTDLDPRQLVSRSPYAIQTRGIFVADNYNVGIGTLAPVWELEVANLTAGDSVEIGLNAHGRGGALAAYSSTFPIGHLANRVSLLSNAFSASGLDLRADGSSSDMRFYTGGFDVAQERMRITDTGSVGIGTPDPISKLDVVGSVRAESLYTVGEQVGTWIGTRIVGSEAIFDMGDSISGFGPIAKATFNPRTWEFTSDVGIKTFSPPAFVLHVNGDAGKPGGGPWSVASDVRLKKNIEPIDDALDTLLRLRGVTFDYIDPDAIHELPGERIGMIAQEVEKVVPDWVDSRNDGYKTVTHRGFEALTVEALRELRKEKNTEVESLRAENVALRTENDAIRARIDSLESLVKQLGSTRMEETNQPGHDSGVDR